MANPGGCYVHPYDCDFDCDYDYGFDFDCNFGHFLHENCLIMILQKKIKIS